MSESTTFSCPSCSAKYKRKGLPAGKKVKCVKCKTIITIPEEVLEELEELEEIEELEELEAVEPAAPRARVRRPEQSSRRRESTASRRPARGGRRQKEAEDAKAKKSSVPILIGVGVLVIALVGFMVFGGGNDPAKVTKPDVVKIKTPKERLDEALAAAESSMDDKEKVSKWMEAVDILDQNKIADATTTTDALFRRVIEVDGDHEKARAELGLYKYSGGFDKYKGQWVTKERITEIGKEFQIFRAEEAKMAAAAKEKARWTKDGWTKKCRKASRYFDRDIASVEGLKLEYFFDEKEVPRPYFLMIEDAEIPTPRGTADIIGPGVHALRNAFARGYQGGILANWDDTQFVVPIFIFKSRKSYGNYRDNGHEYLPNTKSVGAFYVPASDMNMGNIFRGVLYTWQNDEDKSFYSTLFHEAVHQLMHNACEGFRMANTPWLEEGIAEFWSGFTGNKYEGYTFGQFQHGRFSACQDAAEGYYATQRGKKGRRNSFMTPRKLLVDYTRSNFLLDRARQENDPGAQRRISLTYAEGWAFIHFCYNHENGKYREAFEKIVHDELRHDYDPEKVAEYLGCKTDEDWDNLANKFFAYCKRTLRKLRTKSFVPGAKSKGKSKSKGK